MKKLTLIFLLFPCVVLFSQEKATDLFSIKAGLVGAWLGYEKSVNDVFTVNGEIGYEGGVFAGEIWENDFNYVFTSTLSLEARYYYNFNRRIEKGKNTLNNAGNFLGLELAFTPDWGTISNSDDISVVRTFSIIPKYGLRRNLSNKFNFELAFGPGYQWGGNKLNGATFAADIRFGFIL